LPTTLAHTVGKAGLPPETRVGFANSFGPCCWQSKLLAKLGFFANSLVQRICQQHGPMLLANRAVGKAVVPFANRTLPTVVASRKPCWESLRQQGWSLRQQLTLRENSLLPCVKIFAVRFSSGARQRDTLPCVL
jgi:hypothetical protein